MKLNERESKMGKIEKKKREGGGIQEAKREVV